MSADAAFVGGVGLWTGAPSAIAAPTGTGIAARPRRRGSLLMQMAADVAAQATAQAGVPLSAVRLIVGSAFGELGTTVEMLGELGEGGVLSPTRFHNSVHNSAAGALSIAHGNTAAAMSLAAGNDTVAMTLLEALAVARDGGPAVLVIVADEPLPAALARLPAGEAIAAALLLSASDGAPPSRPLARLSALQPPPTPAPGAFRAFEVDAPCAAVLPLISAIRQGRGGRISLAPPGIAGWSISVESVATP